MDDEKVKIIEVERLIHEKSPKLLKYLPKFIIRYLQRILHENDVNEFINAHKNDSPEEFCRSVIKMFNIDIQYEGLENIPKNGGAILTMNHPWGGLDAMALVTVVHDRRPDIKFIVNDVLMHLENLQPLFVGVNKLGKNASRSLRMVEETFAGEELLCIFPAGLVSRKTKGEVRDLKWKKTFVTRSIKYNKVIIPTYIDGKLTNFFYNLSNFRKKIGIKSNIEMLYLVNELYKQHNKKIKIKFGAPLKSENFDDSKSNDEWAQYVKEKVYQLKD